MLEEFDHTAGGNKTFLYGKAHSLITEIIINSF